MSEQECVQTLDGRHHYAPRRWQIRDVDGKRIPPWERGAFTIEIACICGIRPPSEAEVRDQLAETQTERKRQANISKRLLAKDERQGKLAL